MKGAPQNSLFYGGGERVLEPSFQKARGYPYKHKNTVISKRGENKSRGVVKTSAEDQGPPYRGPCFPRIFLLYCNQGRTCACFTPVAGAQVYTRAVRGVTT